MDSNIYIDGKYGEIYPTWHIEDSDWKANQILRILNENKINPANICEVGCGAGGILMHLAKKLPDVNFIGYDIAPYAINICKYYKTERIKFFLKEFTEDTSSNYDVILVIDVIEHIDDYIGFLRKLHNRAEYFVFHIPLDMNILNILLSDQIKNSRERDGHLHYFSLYTALATLKYSGYQIIDHFYTIGKPHKTFKMKMRSNIVKLARKFDENLTYRLFGEASLLVLAK